MSVVSIIGNGFDLAHNMKTSYKDFFDKLPPNKFKTNILYAFLKLDEENNSWIDFENGLLRFLEAFSTLPNSVAFEYDEPHTLYLPFYVLRNTDLYNFYTALRKMHYSFISIGYLNSLNLNSSDWLLKLKAHIWADYTEIKDELIQYLRNQEIRNINRDCLSPSILKTLKESSKIFNFNYTSTIHNYGHLSGKNFHVHGSLDTNIVLGVPYSEIIQSSGFGQLFKTTQRLQFNDIYPDYIFEEPVLELNFIGFSFGQSDHYFFQNIRDSISIHEPLISQHIKFKFFYYDEKAKSDLINNLRIFFGDENLIRYHSKGKILFEKFR